jgi:hypothetical protein
MNELFENTQEIEIWAQWCASIALFRMYRDSTDDLEKGQHRDIFLVGGMGATDIKTHELLPDYKLPLTEAYRGVVKFCTEKHPSLEIWGTASLKKRRLLYRPRFRTGALE